MAGSVQPRAGEINHSSVAPEIAVAVTKPKLGGAIAAGIFVGAVAALLVGGLMGMTETSSGAVVVGQSVTGQ